MVLCLATNKALERKAEPVVKQLQADWSRYEKALAKHLEAVGACPALVEKARQEGRKKPKPPRRPGPRYGQVLYGALQWDRRWRMGIKAERSGHPGRDPKVSVRYLLTDAGGASASASTACGGTRRTA